MHPLDLETARATPPEVTRAAIRLGTKPLLDRDRTPAAALLDTIADVKPSIVALTTHGRSGVARLALGSVATRLIHFSPCPALVVRPSVSDLEEG
jgi:nucleotide-binding universal stress UspA family protein